MPAPFGCLFLQSARWRGGPARISRVTPPLGNSKRIMKPIQNLLVLAAATTTLSSQAAVGTLSGPFTFRNLQVFLVHGDTRLEDRHYSTLAEALAKGMVEVRETGSVNELVIANRSKELVFLNAGDIVKGGRQDRTVKDDLILPPHSGEISLAAFCVEHGRWTGRGQEKSDVFSSTSNMLSSRKQKLAARYESNQSDVWSGVAEQQYGLNSNVGRLAGKSVEGHGSPTPAHKAPDSPPSSLI